MTVALTSENAIDLLRPYNIILDCTDNIPTRYLLSDAAVVLEKPLVSGAAQKYEGQLCVYNLGPTGPCYRCIFPTPPPRETVGSCEELGILGAVTGTIGNMQALETIKIILGLHDQKPSLLLFSALGSPPFRCIKLRQRKPTCNACSNASNLFASISNTDYVQFCGGMSPDWVIQGMAAGISRHRISAREFHELLESKTPIEIIDVRPTTEFGICQLPGSQNIPLKEIMTQPEKYLPAEAHKDFYLICRLGNDSQIAAQALRSVDGDRIIKDVIGGLRAWSNQVDPNFPVY